MTSTSKTAVETPEAIAERIAPAHHECEDIWYSCPKSNDGPYMTHAGTECNCGRDRIVQQIIEAIRAERDRAGPPSGPPSD